MCLHRNVCFQVFLSNTNNPPTVAYFQVFLSNTNNVYTGLWPQVFISNGNTFSIAVYFQIFSSKIINLQTITWFIGTISVE